jgi:DNA mismatch repair protein MutS2
VVPIDIHLGADLRVLLITGPNTGGKTVALKTIGLLAVMSQAGLHIPAGDGSRLPIFSGIYADIGDEQSIEQSLSTFSSHMTHIIDILQRADQQALVLLDELGAGTDPVEGAALAQALIYALLEQGCLTACSSHYSPLKVFAYETPGVENASVEFDVETLSPTYRLNIGMPGRSNALAIAAKLGLASEIIERAQELVPSADVKADILLASAMSAHEAAEKAQAEAETRLNRVRDKEQELRRKLANIEQARRMVLEEARAQARDELQRVRSELRRLRQRVQGVGKPAPPASEATDVLDDLETSVAPIRSASRPSADTRDRVKVGDTVNVTSLDQTGELVRLTDEEAEVRIGGFRLRTDPDLIEFASRPSSAKSAEPTTTHPQPVDSPGVELDLRGLRAEEVAPVLGRYLDSAYLSGLPWARIIHGKGTGVLKSVVRQMLKSHALVDSFRPGELSEGGDGVTVARLHKLEE